MNDKTIGKESDPTVPVEASCDIQKSVEKEAYGPWMLVEKRRWGKDRSNSNSDPIFNNQRENQGDPDL